MVSYIMNILAGSFVRDLRAEGGWKFPELSELGESVFISCHFGKVSGKLRVVEFPLHNFLFRKRTFYGTGYYTAVLLLTSKGLSIYSLVLLTPFLIFVSSMRHKY